MRMYVCSVEYSECSFKSLAILITYIRTGVYVNVPTMSNSKHKNVLQLNVPLYTVSSHRLRLNVRACVLVWYTRMYLFVFFSSSFIGFFFVSLYLYTRVAQKKHTSDF